MQAATEATKATKATEAPLVVCSVCGEPWTAKTWWSGVPGFGEVCDPCHQGLQDGKGGLRFKSPAAYRRWMHGYCECRRKDDQRIGVAVKCRACGGWIE